MVSIFCVRLPAAFCIWYQTVSYTHLRRTASRHKKLFLEGALPDEFKRIYLQSAGYTIVPVSYTHLDVYKRQLLFDTKYKKLLEAGHKKLIP